MTRIPAAFQLNSSRTPSAPSSRAWVCSAPLAALCPEAALTSLFPHRFSFFSRDKKRLATTQRGPHGQESFGQWARAHRDDGYTEQAQEALQHL